MKRNSPKKDDLVHYKMFKDGKHWVYAGITIAGLGSTLMLTTNAFAATTAATSASATTQTLSTNELASSAASVSADTLSASTTSSANSSVASSSTTSTGTPAASQASSATTSQASAANSSSTSSASSQVTSQASNATSQSSVAGNSTVNSASSTATSSAATNNSTVTSAAASSATSTASQSSQVATSTASAAASTAATSDSGHGLIYETNVKVGNQVSKITITQSGPYSVTWTKTEVTNTNETTTVTLDATDIVSIVNTIKELSGKQLTPEVAANLAAAKAKLNAIVTQLKELPTNIASTIVGNVLYPIVFTGSGSQMLSNLRTQMNEHRYDISNTWEGLDPVAYATDRAAAEAYYPGTVTWWNTVTKETWTLPEYNDPTQNVRAYYIQNGNSTKTVIIGQGWTEHVDWIGYVSKIWYDMGYNVLMPSQRGQFLSDGNDLTFGYQDKYDWLNWVKMVDARNGANSEVVFYGQSLGADTVLEAASVPGLSKSVKAVVADAGYATLPELGSSLYTKAIAAVSNALQSVGLSAITQLPFLSYDKIVAAINARLIKEQGFSVTDISGLDAASKVTVPLLLIHTEDDSFIPYTQSLELAAANHSTDQEVWILPGQVGGHAAANNAILQYRQHLTDFLAALVGAEAVEEPTTDTDNNNSGNSNSGDTDTDNTNSGNSNSGDTATDNTNSGDSNSTDDKTTTNDTNTVDLTSDADAINSDTGETVAQTLTTSTSADQIVTNADWLVNHDQSGSAVTASLLRDQSVATPVATDSSLAQTASEDLVPVTSPATAKQATVALPQTDESTSQSWIAAVGVSLLAAATGLWAAIRRRFV
ncbi:serine aminopeptidase domain-containing protein [Lactiplantibacillus herbarum]|uniref:serine aminopeptidase domain-containing protein n=1 Tax=Lactiplantibacillus herbarum TaxID=1670446 RepID=UPI00064E4F8E|nr:alpha/beta hydrolase [Lactiplantibacillus herbarum]